MVRTRIHHIRLLGLALAFVAILPIEGRADLSQTYRFYHITYNDTNPEGGFDYLIGDAQLSVDVSADSLASPRVCFTFNNVGLAESSITDVYFYDGALIDFDAATLSWRGEVSFSQGAMPQDLPGLPKNPTRVYSADSNPGKPGTMANGVNPGEALDILFDLQGPNTLADVLNDLGTEELLVGIHVQGFASGGSEAFVVVPVPAGVVLGMLGLGVAGVKLRKFVSKPDSG
ncbi:MAG: hypothetical protein A2Y76_15905 [Planctomycetes bacterium RBG_13_60_9]|nr:MAG: hypothetical protein A2Y76_15905 [Planctomycetes bacterium RBG_13_60_9]